MKFSIEFLYLTVEISVRYLQNIKYLTKICFVRYQECKDISHLKLICEIFYIYLPLILLFKVWVSKTAKREDHHCQT